MMTRSFSPIWSRTDFEAGTDSCWGLKMAARPCSPAARPNAVAAGLRCEHSSGCRLVRGHGEEDCDVSYDDSGGEAAEREAREAAPHE